LSLVTCRLNAVLTACTAVIVKQVDEKTRGKVGINELLRDI
jgi:tetrahydrodipicolinate N-succinyltransferase